MTLVWMAVVCLGFWFGFEIGRKWHLGEEEDEAEDLEARGARGGIRLKRVTVRR